jgi:hypothetical protein
MMRVFLWVVTSSWATMVADERFVLSEWLYHRISKLSVTESRKYVDGGADRSKGRQCRNERSKGMETINNTRGLIAKGAKIGR